VDLAATKSALFELAESPSLAERRDSLLELAGAIDDEDAHIWAKVDLFAAFGEDAVAVPGADRRDSQITFWEWARNILVLLPLLFTWSGVALASHQYGRLTELAGSADGDSRIREVATRPFIALWEQGFDNIPGLSDDIWRSLAGWFDLTMVALLDLAAILLVIVASIRVGYLRRNREVTLENRFQQVWNQLRETLTHASYHLSKRAFDTPLRVTEELGKATAQLSSITNHVLDAEERAKNRLDDITESIMTFNAGLAAHEEVVAGLNVTARSLSDNLRGARDDIAQIGETFADAAAQERVLVDQLGETTRQLETTTVESLRQASQIASATSELVSALAAERGDHSAVSESLAGSATALRNSADEVRRQWEQLGDNRVDLSGDLQALQGILGQAGEQMQQVADHVNIAYQLFPELQQTNRELADSFRSSTQALNDSARNITTSTSDALGSFLVAATGQLDEQVEAATQQVTASLAEAAASLRSAAEGMLGSTQDSMDSYQQANQEAAASLRSAAEGALGSTQDSMDSYQQANQEVIAGLQEAAQALQAAGTHVSSSWREASDNRGDLQRETVALREAVENLIARLEELAERIDPPQPEPEDPVAD
jgi:chromosome segregation ATPase